MFHSEYLKTLEAALGIAPLQGVQSLQKEAAPNSKALHVKRYLADCEAVLKSRHLALTGVEPLQAGARGAEVCAAYTLVIDGLLDALFKTQYELTGCSDPAALVAIGGYGRGEMNIRSDIDLMLLYRGRMTPAIERLNRALLYVLWDTGLDLGFSIRSIDESIALAKDDLKTMTALLDRRFLLGDRALFDEFERAAVKKLFSGSRVNDFIKSKLDENSERRAKFGGSVYTLEPNVKEGEGGLRDMHTAAWVVKAKNTGPPPALGLRGQTVMGGGFLSEKEEATLRDSLNFILWVRNDLHFSTNRKTDQLTFDHQERISATLGFESARHALPVELFMQQYYRHASNVDHYCALILSRCLHRDRKKSFFWPSRKIKIDKDFEISDGRLALRNKETKSIDGLTAMKAFEYAQSFDATLDQPLKDAILSFAEGCDTLQRSGADACPRVPPALNVRGQAEAGEWRSSEAVAESFIKILKGPNCHRTLAAMHELKFLDAYIPEFAAITCKTQHDLYHVYTVDVHTLFAVREIEMLGGPVEGEFSLLAGICGELTNRAALMLAVLLHDIGKAEGKGHALKGAVMSGDICRRLHMPDDDAALVEFLIMNHLILADTAQYRDLHDEKLIVEFAKKVGDVERLGLLYLLTFADVRAVGPDVWSQWKGALFQELYFKASTVLERGTFEIEDAGAKLKRTQEKTVELLEPSGIMRDYVEEFFKLLPQRYFLANSAETIAGHIKTVRNLSGEPYVMSIRQDKAREYTEFVICTHDVHGLFSMITGVMAANSVNILGAQVNTLKNGIVLDCLQVTTPMGGLITDEHKLRRIEGDLAGVITGKLKVAALVHRHRKPSILDMKAKPRVPTRVQIDNDASDAYTVVDIKTHNRIGLLYDITSTLSRLGLYIYISKISTKGDEAADIFYVKDIFGQKIFYKEKLRDIADTVYGVLTGISGTQSSK